MTAPAQPESERLARGALLQQGAQIVRLVGSLLILTVLARTLSLPELGTYTLLLSLITYVHFVKSSVMNAAVLSVSEAGENPEPLNRVVCTGLAVYSALGVLSGVVLAAIGLLALPILNVPESLQDSARTGVLGLALVVGLGWPVQIFDDLLRGLQRFAAVSALEIAGMVAYVGGALALVLADAPVWMLVTWSASISFVTGMLCLVALPFLGIRLRFSRGLVDRGEARRFGSVSSQLVVAGIADLAVYSLDRAILSAMRSPAEVGRYEGPLQMQGIVRYLQGIVNAPMIPIAARYIAEQDTQRLRALFLRGLRYSLAATTPFALVLTIQAEPIMTAWLGDRFASVAPAATLFCAWWIIGGNAGAVGGILLGARRIRLTVVTSWAVAVVNLPLTLLLTPSLGLYGPIIGAVAGFAAALAIAMPFAVRIAGSRWRDVAREAWLPAYSVGAILTVALLGLRSVVDLSGDAVAMVTLCGFPVAYWALYAVMWLRPDERTLVRRTITRRGAP